MTTKAKKSVFKFDFKKNDIILLGRESKGVPEFIHNFLNNKLKIPYLEKSRSLNVALSAAISAAEALRQLKNFNMKIEDKKKFSDKWFSYLQDKYVGT